MSYKNIPMKTNNGFSEMHVYAYFCGKLYSEHVHLKAINYAVM